MGKINPHQGWIIEKSQDKNREKMPEAGGRSIWIVVDIILANPCLLFALTEMLALEVGLSLTPSQFQIQSCLFWNILQGPLSRDKFSTPNSCDQEGREQQNSSRVIRLCSSEKLGTVSNRGSYCLIPWYKSTCSGNQKPEVWQWEVQP